MVRCRQERDHGGPEPQYPSQPDWSSPAQLDLRRRGSCGGARVGASKLIGGRESTRDDGADVGSQPAAVPSGANKLDPGPYRSQITQLEQHLYREQPGGIDDAGRVAALARDLSLAVRGDGRDLARLRAWGELFDFAGEADGQSAEGYTTGNLPQLRSRWEQVRDEVFAPADWLRSSSPALTQRQTPTPPVADRGTIRGLRDMATQLEALIRNGSREALAIPEAGVDAALESSEAREAERRWRQWSARWLRQLDGVVRYMPASPGPNADINVTIAHQELSRAVSELRHVTQTAASTTTIPFKYEREQHFDSARRYIDQARSYLNRVEW
ncbi:MAG: hypothetical protein JSW71_20815 [Gemmatimonadota bacterium]|nr:MAG: hypothetical protein JSW71_20815 [Gemmatimonadota bacterium]